MFNLFGTKSATVQLKDDPSVRRSHISPDELVTGPPGGQVKTMADIFSYTVRHHSSSARLWCVKRCSDRRLESMEIKSRVDIGISLILSRKLNRFLDPMGGWRPRRGNCTSPFCPSEGKVGVLRAGILYQSPNQ